jgi:predicted lipoprotein with Yx(FWY)xxD motif
MVGRTRRSDGKPQVTYNGHPLYLYQGDGNPGDTNGQGITAFGAAWYALSPAGNQLTGQSSSSAGNGGY